ncbi:class I SAM-dependent methyltransferase [Limobrevibacterium gyesilva]|uniref:Class I SAM-dependent methyltransferase n=1 Tax=Limobrevibacterium gyesilva TaxID=2991712 RepID=A0AA42CK46_9PROT|nr:class I SAM-dependent methyltransferase [Limobrevibacterium gyesilva]MCW3477542.1 class I SAM-dependent methyltransferase [Limobrevibacterium gyesilva]
MRHRDLVPHRERIAGAAEGRVLEIGIGSGLNLPFYGPSVREVLGIDPSPALLAMAEPRCREAAFPVKLIEGTSEHLPLEDGSVETVVTTWTMCSVGDPLQALQEARRVLRTGGKLLFVEHGRAPEPGVRKWQDRLTPAWRRIAGGCHLNRKIDELIVAAGFRIDSLETGYLRGPKPMTFTYEGQAKPR